MERVLRASEKTVSAVSETVDISDMVDKIDELVQWINEHERGGERNACDVRGQTPPQKKLADI